MHTLVRLTQPDRVYLAHAHELGERSEYGLDRALAFALHISALWAFHPCDVPFIFGTVICDRELFLVDLAKTAFPERAALADLARCSVGLLFRFGTAVQEHFFERDYLAPRAEIMVGFLHVGKTTGTALVRAVGRDKAFQVPVLQKGIVLTGTVAGVGYAVLPVEALLP